MERKHLMIKIDGIISEKEIKSEIEVNYYVSLKFRTQSNSIEGARYMYIEHSNQSMIEFILPLNSMALKGFSILLIKKRLYQTLRGPDNFFVGIPIFAMPEGKVFSGGTGREYMKLDADLGAFIGLNFIEIIINNYKQFDTSIQCGDVQFLLWNYCLAGIKVLNRSKEDLEIFAQHLKE